MRAEHTKRIERMNCRCGITVSSGFDNDSNLGVDLSGHTTWSVNAAEHHTLWFTIAYWLIEGLTCV